MLMPLLLSLSISDANAQNRNQGPHMYAVGATLSTLVFPGAYPGNFPKNVDNGDPNPRDTLELVRGDAGLAARGIVYLDNQNRIGLRLERGFGVGDGGDMRRTVFTIEYEKSLLRQDQVQVFAGGGIGFGRLNFDQGDNGELTLNTWNTRLQVAANYRYKRGRKQGFDDMMFEVALFVSPIGFNGPETFTIGNVTVEDPAGAGAFAFLTSNEDDNQKLNGSLYNPTAGLEFTFFYGDLTPPQKRRRGNRNRGGGNKKKKNNNNRR